MPKDNEVDEKVIQRYAPSIDCDGAIDMEPSEFGTWISLSDHAATVAELRARIDRLAELRANDAAYIKKLDGIIEETGARPVSCINPYEDLKAVVLALKKRADEADAAERRVGELEGALHVVHDQHKWMYGERDREKARADRLESFVSAVRKECFDYWNEGIRPWPHHMQTLAWKAEDALKPAALSKESP